MILFGLADLSRASDDAESAFLSLVAERDIRSVTRPESVVTLRRYGRAAHASAIHLMSLAWWRCLQDRLITSEEAASLAHLQSLLDLSEDDAFVLRERYVYPYLQNAVYGLALGSHSPNEGIAAISALAADLRLSPSEFEMLIARARKGMAVLPESPEYE